jgi:hypothetical protein
MGGDVGDDDLLLPTPFPLFPPVQFTRILSDRFPRW